MLPITQQGLISLPQQACLLCPVFMRVLSNLSLMKCLAELEALSATLSGGDYSTAYLCLRHDCLCCSSTTDGLCMQTSSALL